MLTVSNNVHLSQNRLCIYNVILTQNWVPFLCNLCCPHLSNQESMEAEQEVQFSYPIVSEVLIQKFSHWGWYEWITVVHINQTSFPYSDPWNSLCRIRISVRFSGGCSCQKEIRPNYSSIQFTASHYGTFSSSRYFINQLRPVYTSNSVRLAVHRSCEWKYFLIREKIQGKHLSGVGLLWKTSWANWSFNFRYEHIRVWWFLIL